MNANRLVRLVDVTYSMGGKRASRWQSMDIIFQEVTTGLYVRHKFFAPDTYQDRREIAAVLRHIIEFFEHDWNAIPFCYDWVDVVGVMRKLLSENFGDQFFVKIIKRNDREMRGTVLPILSRDEDLYYAESEILTNMTAGESEPAPAGVFQETKEKVTQASRRRERDVTDDLPF